MLSTESLKTADDPLLRPGSYRLVADHLGAGIDMLAAAKGTAGTLAPGRAYLLVRRTSTIQFLFHFGTVVTIAFSPAGSGPTELSEFRDYVSSPNLQVTDEFVLAVSPEEKERVDFGKVTIQQGDLDRIVLVATALAQSNTLDHYERLATDLMESSSGLTDRMSEGKMPPTGRKMLEYIGKSLAMRRELVSHLSVLDPPESVWESDSLDILYHALRNNFEIPQRMRVVEHKLELIKETADIVVSINESRRSHSLEVIIIVLIAIEIVLYIIGH